MKIFIKSQQRWVTFFSDDSNKHIRGKKLLCITDTKMKVLQWNILEKMCYKNCIAWEIKKNPAFYSGLNNLFVCLYYYNSYLATQMYCSSGCVCVLGSLRRALIYVTFVKSNVRLWNQKNLLAKWGNILKI